MNRAFTHYVRPHGIVGMSPVQHALAAAGDKGAPEGKTPGTKPPASQPAVVTASAAAGSAAPSAAQFDPAHTVGSFVPGSHVEKKDPEGKESLREAAGSVLGRAVADLKDGAKRAGENVVAGAMQAVNAATATNGAELAAAPGVALPAVVAQSLATTASAAVPPAGVQYPDEQPPPWYGRPGPLGMTLGAWAVGGAFVLLAFTFGRGGAGAGAK